MTSSSPEARWQLLQGSPGFTALAEACPEEWAAVHAELSGVFERCDAGEIRALIARSASRGTRNERFLSGERSGRAFELFVSEQIRQRLTELALRQYAFSAATGIKAGKARFNLFNGLIAQRLLFKQGLERKPVSLRAFRLLWPLLWQKRLLMPLVEKRGIYCFYSRELIAGLASLICNRKALEIAAGDGTLARFLTGQGASVLASDDHSWGKAVDYPATVEKLDAVAAIARHQPKVVICCWPPAGNHFERQVFRSRSVDTYIVIGSRSRFITGNWADYTAQTAFDWAERADLSQLVLPPELQAGVWVFQRKPVVAEQP
ncbi:hypothetical protein IGB42_00974 [Andreprevotia sp. IGB-42]|uniref:SAM-dependent methyltransferase n=1 Tax=Andreprevotia sp. IGB-42 TaxID=2497473 RepID=UPI00135C0A74|nr:SAM-dependent methyltransferase [Andreprevotia sp. IGB-42]KAF0814918.1 hypothetical protein IGB42_00974 [Andreprevotia sp. IGB-42]